MPKAQKNRMTFSRSSNFFHLNNRIQNTKIHKEKLQLVLLIYNKRNIKIILFYMIDILKNCKS